MWFDKSFGNIIYFFFGKAAVTNQKKTVNFIENCWNFDDSRAV